MTKISVPGQAEYSFQFKESLMPARTQPVSIEDILSRTNEWENVTLSGKVVRVGDISTVGAKQLKSAETTSAVLKTANFLMCCGQKRQLFLQQI